MEESIADADCMHTNEEPKPLSELVITAVADAEGVDPVELTPLYSAVDPEALDALFHLPPTSEPPTGEVRFSYHGYVVRITAAGRVELTEE